MTVKSETTLKFALRGETSMPPGSKSSYMHLLAVTCSRWLDSSVADACDGPFASSLELEYELHWNWLLDARSARLASEGCFRSVRQNSVRHKCSTAARG